MKLNRTNKRGFTIVELVIVIAVIAILAAVLIPTFSGLVEKANKNAALTEAKNNMTNDLVNAEADYANMLTYDDNAIDSAVIKQYYIIEGNKAYSPAPTASPEEGEYATIAENGVVTVETSGWTATSYYIVAEYFGVYNGSTWVDEVNGYTCTFDVASGEWTVEKS